jgi:N-acetylglucosamine kinase-like BadF-type ATPase
MAVVLGIDGGGTKTKCAISRDGSVIGTAITGASNLVRNSEDDVRTALHAAIGRLVTPLELRRNR